MTALVLSAILRVAAEGGTPGRVDPAFDAGSGIDGNVRLAALQADGRIVIAGEFSIVGGFQRTAVARLNPDGTCDPAFVPGDAGEGQYFNSLAVHPDGSVLLGSDSGIMRLHPDGSPDHSFQAPLQPIAFPWGDSLGVWSIAVQPDGKIVVGGNFWVQNGSARNYGVARLHPDGTLDAGFRASFGGVVETTAEGVGAVAVANDGRILVGGWFTTANGVPRQSLARLHSDGRLDTGFHPAGTIDGTVWKIIPQPDGKVLASGAFQTASRTNRSIVRLNSNGSPDTTFVSGADLYEVIYSMALQHDGKVLVCGGVDVFGWAGERMTRLHPDGSRDSTFHAQGAGEVSQLAVQSDGDVIAVGEFVVEVSGRPMGASVARFDPHGIPDAAFAANVGNPGHRYGMVRSIVVQPDGKLLLGGTSLSFDGHVRYGVTRLEADGTADPGFQPGTGVYGFGVEAVALQADGRILIGGLFEDAGRTEYLSLARLEADGRLDAEFRPDLDEFLDPGDCQLGGSCFVSFYVSALVPQADGRLLVAGTRETVVIFPSGSTGTSYSSFVGRLLPDGTRDPSFVTAMVAPFPKLVVQPDGRVLVAGSHGVTRLNDDGSIDLTFDPGSGPGGGTVHAVALQSDARMIVAGDLVEFGGVPRSLVARLEADGTLDESFDPGAVLGGTVFAVAVDEAERVIVGGDLFTWAGADRADVVRLLADGRLDPTFDPGAGPGSRHSEDIPVRVIVLQADGKLLIGGRFTTVDGIVRPAIARLFGGTVPPPLAISRSGGFVVLTWSTAGPDFALQTTPDLTSPPVWSPVEEPVVIETGLASVRVPIRPGGGFFRLQPLPPQPSRGPDP